MENYKELLTALYKEHAPNKIDQIDFYLDRYKGKEKQFYITQKAKYAKKRSVTDSKKILEEAMARIRAQKEKTAASKKTETKQTIPKPIMKAETPKKQAVTESPAFEEKKTIKIKETANKAIIIDTSKKEAPLVKDDKKDVSNVDTSNKTELKKEEKLNVKIVDTTAALNPSLKKTKNETITTTLKTKQEEKGPKVEEKIDVNKTTIPRKENKLADLEEAKARLKKSRKKEEKKPVAIKYIGAIALLILIMASIVYFMNFYKKEKPVKEPVKVQKVVIENKKISTEQDTNPPIVEKEKENPKKKAFIEEEKEPIKEQKKKPKKEVVREKPVKKQRKTRITTERLYSKDFSHPAVFVGCFAVKSENLAQDKVALLKEHKLKAHYYWIPDMDASGNEYFKVVIGPFSSLGEAYPSLTKVQERINFDAYILILQ